MELAGILFIVGRILFGGYFIKSSWAHFAHHKDLVGYAASKKVPLPNIGVFVAGVLILLGGLGVLLGVYVQWAVICLVLFLVPVTFFMHRYWEEQDMAKMSDQVNFYKNLALLGAALMLLAIPVPWPWAIF